jgi:hypothetical protein
MIVATEVKKLDCVSVNLHRLLNSINLGVNGKTANNNTVRALSPNQSTLWFTFTNLSRYSLSCRNQTPQVTSL